MTVNPHQMQATFTKHRPPAEIANELRFLEDMQSSGYVPEVLSHTADSITLEAIQSEMISDADEFLHNCCEALSALYERGIIHGDLTDRNILIRENRPCIIDFAESRYADEQTPDKREGGDALWLWRAYEGLTGDPRRHARRWLAIRERLQIHHVRSITDLGCGDGDIVLMAQAEGYNAIGYDNNQQGGVVRGKHVVPRDILREKLPKSDAMFLLSVWPYLLERVGWHEAKAWLLKLPCSLFYFECQLAGDGPGPVEFKTKQDIFNYLSDFGTVTELVTIPILDRNTERTTFEVVRHARY
jgi:serine/threonine protein kinase